jgi:type II restriction enzyme
MDKLSLLLTERCHEIETAKNWKSVSKIVGEAAEDCMVTLPCPLCQKTSLVKYKTNQKSKDVLCEKCGCQIQIKATKHTKKAQTSIKLLGAEYRTTLSSVKENNVHYLVLLYSTNGGKYTIHDICLIHHDDINESCIIPRKPLSSAAKRAGWQGCMLVFSKFDSVSVDDYCA